MRYVRIDGSAVVEVGEFEGDVAAMFHPSLVWVASDSAQISDVWDGQAFSTPAAPAPDMAATAADYDARLNRMFDSVARSKTYDSRITCALRAGYPGPYQQEGIAFGSWMDACNALAYQLYVQAQQSGVIPTWDEVLAQMPPMNWPA